MSAWTRLSDWIAIAGGILVALSPSLVPTTPASAGAMALLGGLLAIAGVINLAAPSAVFVFWFVGGFGLLLFLTPWLLGSTSNAGSSWIAWIIGLITLVIGFGSAVRSSTTHAEETGPRAA